MKREILTWMETKVDGNPTDNSWYGMAKADGSEAMEMGYKRGEAAEGLGLVVNNGCYMHVYATSFNDANYDKELSIEDAVFYISAREKNGLWFYEFPSEETVKGKKVTGESLVILVNDVKYWLRKGWPDGPKEV